MLDPSSGTIVRGKCQAGLIGSGYEVAARGLPLENQPLHRRRCNWVPTQQCLSNDAQLGIEADTAAAPA